MRHEDADAASAEATAPPGPKTAETPERGLGPPIEQPGLDAVRPQAHRSEQAEESHHHHHLGPAVLCAANQPDQTQDPHPGTGPEQPSHHVVPDLRARLDHTGLPM